MNRTEASWWLDDDDYEYATAHPTGFWSRGWPWWTGVGSAALVLVTAAVAIAVWSATTRRAPSVAIQPPVDVTPTQAAADGTPLYIKVDVHGDVRKPGVYSLAGNARLQDAVKAAGGFIHSEDASAVNGAQPLNDGQEVVVPNVAGSGSIGAVEQSASFAFGSGTTSGARTQRQSPRQSALPALKSIDVNMATAATLMTLPGIGPVKAAAIIHYRTQHGLFHTLNDLRHVHGIGPVTWSRITPYLFVAERVSRKS